jgi:protein-L-isoaspartate(D-aspartate) O-methyltransferase
VAILRPRSEVSQADEEVRLAQRRAVMVERDLRRRGIRDDRVLNAMLSVPRHRFVTPNLAAEAYADTPLPTRLGQTISQPYIVALMTQAVGVTNGARVLEIGTGSGYQAAVLAALGADVWSVEASPELHGEAAARLRDLGFSAVHLRCGDGTLGWPDAAPFDGILATGSLPERPTALLRQLRPGGVFVGPIGPLGRQRLVRLEVDPPREREETLCVCSFVPLVGAAGWRSRTDQEG